MKFCVVPDPGNPCQESLLETRLDIELKLFQGLGKATGSRHCSGNRSLGSLFWVRGILVHNQSWLACAEDQAGAQTRKLSFNTN